MQQRGFGVVGVFQLLIPVGIVAGVLTFFGPCVHDDGSIGSCFWASRAVVGVAGIAAFMGLVRLPLSDIGMRRGLDFALFLSGLLLVALMLDVHETYYLMHLCAMKTMHCNTYMRPFVLVCGGLLTLLSLVAMFMDRTKKSKA